MRKFIFSLPRLAADTVLAKIDGLRGTAKRGAAIGQVSPENLTVLEAMCFAAKTRGKIADEDLTDIKTVADAMTGATFPMQTVKKTAALAETTKTEHEVMRLVSTAPLSIQDQMMRAVLYVVSADGQVIEREWDFVTKLATGMKLSGDKLRQLIAETLELRTAA
ncbi:hypothetical protein U5922_002390 [Aquicoccus sp. G2-2]|uniref:hypothetical protein n=1 Tax=Aquicoccus sp. G2-2 TaxID=3092120 RepID=UPI002ADF42B8|nr:hypothetical protein [Aquicoccus sp. G2-2]MEA1112371.1 hypothetical protein [Aquicoccus sp. G2-2]